MKIFDTHTHYMSNDYSKDLDNVLMKIKESGVDKVCEISASLADSLNMQSFLLKINTNNNYPCLYHAIGIHPDEIKNYEYGTQEFFDYFNKLDNCVGKDGCVAIGEIGLDYFGDKDDEKKINQKMWFIEQIKLSKKYDLPLVVHSRDACKDTMDIIKEFANNYHGIIHCFSYESDIAKEYIKMGYMIGVGGVVTYKNGRKLQEVVQNIPLEYIVTETDAPYLSPEPHRGERNDSSNIRYVIEKICDLKNKDVEEVSTILYNNALKVFNIK